MQNCARVAVFGIIFAVEIEQKQAIWCLKRKSLLIILNVLVYLTFVKINIFVIMLIFLEKKTALFG